MTSEGNVWIRCNGLLHNLSMHPEMGAALSLQDPKLAGLRKWQIKV
jgi:hypothetical protein